MRTEVMVAMLVSFLGKTEDFTKDVVKSFSNVGPNGTQFGAVYVSGSSNQTTAFDLNDHSNAADILNALDSIPNGRSHLGPALEYLENNLFNVDGTGNNGAGQPCAVDNRFAIVITDGNTAGGTVPKAQSLKNANVKIIAVGVRKDIDISLLQAIASGNQNVFHVGDFRNLSSILDGVVSAI
ncbi:COL6A [Mytilus coruscus]|uniref:COL6A n=1 Tax=Mytilus coruscus TaxID=42192 RepID=A0A6J8DWN3_MYTCO|nr:COL6A [Mytilus coruscus]